MTTIVWRGNILATDSLSTIGKVKCDDRVKKLWRLPSGSAMALCGDLANAQDFVRAWFKAAKAKTDFPELPKGVNAVVLTKRQGVWVGANQCWARLPKRTQYHTEGSGWAYAEAALRAGANARDAVKIAAGLDMYSGGRVQWMKV